MAAEAFRLCVDLNVWVSGYLAHVKGNRGASSRFIVEAIQDGRSGVGPIQLIVSHSMLSRLHDVLVRMGASLDAATQFIALIESIARLGPSRERPHIVLGGGVIPTRDAIMPRWNPYDAAMVPWRHDVEDGRVIDVAIGARADALVTANMRDFIASNDTLIAQGRVHIRHTAGHDLVVVRPQEMAQWLRTGQRPTADHVRQR